MRDIIRGYINDLRNDQSNELRNYESNELRSDQSNELRNYESNELRNDSAGFTYRLDRLKPRAITFRGPLAKVYNIFNTVIGLSHLCYTFIIIFAFIKID